jgi:hypothetical protein
VRIATVNPRRIFPANPAAISADICAPAPRATDLANRKLALFPLQFCVTIVTQNCSGAECSAEISAGDRAGRILENDRLRGGGSLIQDVDKKRRRATGQQTAQTTQTTNKTRASGSAPLGS